MNVTYAPKTNQKTTKEEKNQDFDFTQKDIKPTAWST